MRLILNLILVLVFSTSSYSQDKKLNTMSLIEKIDKKREAFFIDSIPERFKMGMYSVSNITNLKNKIQFVKLPEYAKKDTIYIMYYCEYYHSISDKIIGELWNDDFVCKYLIKNSKDLAMITNNTLELFDQFKKLIEKWDEGIKDRSYAMTSYFGVGGIVCSRVKIRNYKIIEDEHIAFVFFDPKSNLIFLREQKSDGYKMRYKYKGDDKIYIR